MTNQRDIDEVEALLGRKPQGEFEVVVRSSNGAPMVISNAPLLDDGRPMPTRFWLVDKALVKAIGRIESTGGVNQAEAAVDPEQLEACHLRHNLDRAALLPEGYEGPKPYGGIGGTRVGVKCLHAHYANFLVGADDPVGRWVHERLVETDMAGPKMSQNVVPTEQNASQNTAAFDVYAAVASAIQLTGRCLVVHLDTAKTYYVLGNGDVPAAAWVADLSGRSLRTAYLASDPPKASELSAALSIVELHVTDVLRELPKLPENLDEISVVASGDAHLIAAVELGVEAAELKSGARLRTADAEELFRAVATEPLSDREHNPGLPKERADDIVGGLCVLLETLRQLGVDDVRVAAPERSHSVRALQEPDAISMPQ